MVDTQVCKGASTHQAIRQEGGLVKGTSVKKLVGIPTQPMSMKMESCVNWVSQW